MSIVRVRASFRKEKKNFALLNMFLKKEAKLEIGEEILLKKKGKKKNYNNS